MSSAPVQVSIDADAVTRLVSEAVLKSKIGEAVEASVKRVLADLSKSWDNPIDKVVHQHVAEMVREILQTNHAEDIRKRVADALAGKLTDEFLHACVQQAAGRFR